MSVQVNSITSLDLGSSNVDPEDPMFQPMLTDLQANILKGHGRNYAYHIFLQLHPDAISQARKWLSDFARANITSAMSFELASQRRKVSQADGGPVFTLSVSATGYAALGYTDEQLPQEQVTPGNRIVGDDPAFRNGAKGSAVKLGDGTIDIDWEEPFRNNVDVLVLVADSDPSKAAKLSQGIISEVSAFSTVLLSQRGSVLRSKLTPSEDLSDFVHIEHFGYADGVSQPLYFKDDIAIQSGISHWNDAEPLSLVLVPDPNGRSNNSFGSFLVVRKLEQNIAAFEDARSRLSGIKDVHGTVNPDLSGAMMVGRFRNGNVVVNSDGQTGQITKRSQLTNDFDYSNDIPPWGEDAAYSSKCPYFAHIRLTNPRLDINVNPKVPAPQLFVHGIRLTRRGIPYQDILRFGPGTEDLIYPTEVQLNDNRPTKGVGLLFMSYQAHIGKQFEFIQNNWSNHGHIAGRNVGPDGITGQTAPPPATGLPFKPETPAILNRKLPEQWGAGIPSTAEDISFGDFVKHRGGEYFFTPSISFLVSLSK